MAPALASTQYAQLDAAPDYRGRTAVGGPGEIVTMTDGERWFHPYSGGAPTRLPCAANLRTRYTQH